MSLHYSKFVLNTYWGTPYFQAHAPPDYPIGPIAQKCRAFRRLPPRLRELCGLAKRWEERVNPNLVESAKQWYDAEGYELNPDTGARLTDAEIDAEWGAPDPSLANLEVEDIPLPPGGFADPDTWEPPPEPEEPAEYEGPTMEQLVDDIGTHGREYAARYYGIPRDRLEASETDVALAKVIYDEMRAGFAS